MTNLKETERSGENYEASAGGAGDVERAGETTAAAAIESAVVPKPVGADTRVRVEGDADAGEDNG